MDKDSLLARRLSKQQIEDGTVAKKKVSPLSLNVANKLGNQSFFPLNHNSIHKLHSPVTQLSLVDLLQNKPWSTYAPPASPVQPQSPKLCQRNLPTRHDSSSWTETQQGQTSQQTKQARGTANGACKRPRRKAKAVVRRLDPISEESTEEDLSVSKTESVFDENDLNLTEKQLQELKGENQRERERNQENEQRERQQPRVRQEQREREHNFSSNPSVQRGII